MSDICGKIIRMRVRDIVAVAPLDVRIHHNIVMTLANVCLGDEYSPRELLHEVMTYMRGKVNPRMVDYEILNIFDVSRDKWVITEIGEKGHE